MKCQFCGSFAFAKWSRKCEIALNFQCQSCSFLFPFRICEIVSQMRNGHFPKAQLWSIFAFAKSDRKCEMAIFRITPFWSNLAFARSCRKCDMSLNPKREITYFLTSPWFQIPQLTPKHHQFTPPLFQT